MFNVSLTNDVVSFEQLSPNYLQNSLCGPVSLEDKICPGLQVYLHKFGNKIIYLNTSNIPFFCPFLPLYL